MVTGEKGVLSLRVYMGNEEESSRRPWRCLGNVRELRIAWMTGQGWSLWGLGKLPEGGREEGEEGSTLTCGPIFCFGRHG